MKAYWHLESRWLHTLELLLRNCETFKNSYLKIFEFFVKPILNSKILSQRTIVL